MCCDVFILPPNYFCYFTQLTVSWLTMMVVRQANKHVDGTVSFAPAQSFDLLSSLPVECQSALVPRSLTRCGPCSTNVNACAQPGMASSSRSDCLARQGASRSVSSQASQAKLDTLPYQDSSTGPGTG